MRRITRTEFDRHLGAFREQSARAGYLDAEAPAGARCYYGAWGGYALTPDGTLHCLHAVRGHGARLLADAVQRGAHRLECLGDGLRDWYARHGWRVMDIYPWDPALAPAGVDPCSLYIMEA